MRKALLLFTLSMLFVQPLSAQESNINKYKYFGIMAGSSTYKEPGYKFKVTSAAAKLGFRFNRFLGVELHGGLGGSDDNNLVTFDLNYTASAFLRADWSPNSDQRIKLYLLGGITAADLEFTSGATNTSSTESGFSYALGIDLYANPKNGIYFQWGRYLDGTLNGVDYTLDNAAVGYIKRF